jgi:hypothetical protein
MSKKSILPRFLSVKDLPQTENEIIEVLHCPDILEIRNFVLGPGMISNIPQACSRWLKRTGLESKGTLVFGRTPDEYLVSAQAVKQYGVVPLYWTCAVFGREKDLFFGSGIDTLMFWVQEVMPLDHMQLAVRPKRLKRQDFGNIAKDCVLPPGITKLASHASPKPLLNNLFLQNPHCSWIEATSNGAAAEMVNDGQADMCVTTKAALKKTGLKCVHEFGCPPMVFFGGLTNHGARVVSRAYQLLNSGQNIGGFPPSDSWPY